MSEMPANVYFNLEAESGLIGCAIIAPDRCLKLVTEAENDDFYSEKNRAIQKCLAEMAKEKAAVDLVTVDAWMAKNGTNKDVGTDYLIDCTTRGCLTVNAPDYLKIVQQCAMRRKLYKIGKEIMTRSGAEDDPEETRDWAARSVKDVRIGNTAPLISADDALMTTWKQLETETRKEGEPSKRILSGIATLDNKLGGLRGGEYVAIGARPSVGKSILALTFCVNAARQGKRVLLVSLEMNEVQITERIMADQADLPLSVITSGELKGEDWRTLAKGVGKISSLPLWYSMEASTVEKVRRAAYSLYENGGLDMIAVDYLQLMEATYAKRQTRQEQIAEISRGLRLLAAELKIPVLVLTQLNRSSVNERVDGKKVKREPTMSEARESGSIEQDANIFILLHNPGKDEMTTDGEKAAWANLDAQGYTMMRLIIDKNRQGKRGRITVAFDGDHMRFLPIVRKE